MEVTHTMSNGFFSNIFGGGKQAEKPAEVNAETVAAAFNALPADQQALVAEAAKTYQKPAEPAPAPTEPAKPAEQPAEPAKAEDKGKVEPKTANDTKPAEPAPAAQPTAKGKVDMAKILADNQARTAQPVEPAPAQPAAQPVKPEPTPTEPIKPEEDKFVSRAEQNAYTAKLEQILEQQNKQHAEQMSAMRETLEKQEKRMAQFLNPEKEYGVPLGASQQPKRSTHAEVVAKYIGGNRK